MKSILIFQKLKVFLKFIDSPVTIVNPKSRIQLLCIIWQLNFGARV